MLAKSSHRLSKGPLPFLCDLQAKNGFVLLIGGKKLEDNIALHVKVIHVHVSLFTELAWGRSEQW